LQLAFAAFPCGRDATRRLAVCCDLLPAAALRPPQAIFLWAENTKVSRRETGKRYGSIAETRRFSENHFYLFRAYDDCQLSANCV
jgi:hypothetical protein